MILKSFFFQAGVKSRFYFMMDSKVVNISSSCQKPFIVQGDVKCHYFRMVSKADPSSKAALPRASIKSLLYFKLVSKIFFFIKAGVKNHFYAKVEK